MKLISVIIPVYNHAHTLKKCVDSVIGQTYRPVEIIIVNDGSTDGFDAVINEIKNNVGVNLVIINQENNGAGAARNRGFAEAKGEYVIFWDADTDARPDMLEKLSLALDKNPDINYAYSKFKFGWKTMHSHEFDAGLLKKTNYIDTTSLLRREDFCGFDESLKRFIDWDLWLTLLEKNKTGIFVPEILFNKDVGGRKGISSWLPEIFFKLPFKTKGVQKYEAAQLIVLRKHGLIGG
jgi:glycosyltransferase involved in cell wall biosynthesis